MTDTQVTEWTLDGVLDEMKVIHGAMTDRQFAFILGAGASFTSGIPTGQGLAQKWLKDLHLRECSDGRSLEQWISECGVGHGDLTLNTAAEYYPQIFERRFAGDREAGYAELESAMEGKSPSLGYSLLAEIIQHTRHKVVVTTNFDNLVADALAMHAHQSPLVVAHESLAGFVRPQMRRPLVAKIHRDLYLHPINDPDGVSMMEQGWKIALKKLFQYYTPIVVGYGGNDGSLMDMLIGLDQGDIAGRMIWCYREGAPPPEKALKVLHKHCGILVKITGFDGFMLQLADKLVRGFDVADIAERTEKLGMDRASRYREQASKLSEASIHGTPAEQRAGAVLTQSVRSGQSWWAWEIKAKTETDPEKRRLIYLEGIAQFPLSSELLANYASFLDSQDEDPDAVKEIYLKAIAIDPNDAHIVGRYASFLDHREEDSDLVEKLYQKAIELGPYSVVNLIRYARFQSATRKNDDAAESLYKSSIELDPSSGYAACSYANFLASRRKDYIAADKFFRKSIALDPNDSWNTGNYAIFLDSKIGDNNTAEEFYKKAIDSDPNDIWIAGKYIDFLKRLGRNL